MDLYCRTRGLNVYFNATASFLQTIIAYAHCGLNHIHCVSAIGDWLWFDNPYIKRLHRKKAWLEHEVGDPLSKMRPIHLAL